MLLLLIALPLSLSRKGSKLLRNRTRRSSLKSGVGELQAALVAPGDPVLSSEQHTALGAAREQVQEDMVGGVQAYTYLAQRALGAGELAAASRFLTEGLAVVGAAGPEAEFLAGSLLMVQASVLKCTGDTALALEAFDQMSKLLPTDLGPDPDRQENVRSLFRLDLLRTLMHDETAELQADRRAAKTRWSALSRRRKIEEDALLRGGPWTSLAQLPRDYQSGLRAHAWWNLDEEGLLREPDAPARLLKTLQTARQGLVKEYEMLARAGKITPERECIHGRIAEGFGEWMQYDFLGGAVTAQQTASSTAVLHTRPRCERGVAPAGCAAVAAAEAVLRDGGWGAAGTAGSREPLVLRAGYSAVEPGAWIRPHFGETNAQLKLHFGLIVPIDSSGKACALLRVGTSTNKTTDTDHEAPHRHSDNGTTEWKSWSQGGLLLFDDSFEHEVRVQRAKNATSHDVNEARGCVETRVVLQLVLRHPDLRVE